MAETSSLDTGVIDDLNIKDYIQLLKPRVMTLVVFTGFVGMWLAPGFSDTHPVLAFLSIFALALGAGAAGGINMWYDADIDSVMKRTQNRPIPSGRVDKDSALLFSVMCSVTAVLLLGLSSNWLAAGILAFANVFYSVFYTMILKRRTPQNIVIGGAAGAFPPLIGWTAITGSVDIYPLIMFAVIFFWTPPHFWALSLYASDDYERAKVPMLPNVAGKLATKIQMLLYTLLLLPLCLSPYFLGFTGIVYTAGAAILNGLFILSAIKVLNDGTDKHAKRMFAYSIFYLFALFILMMVGSI